MCCIEGAQHARQEFIANRVERGFPQPEAEFLTGIEVDLGDQALEAYSVRDLDRLTSRQLVEYFDRFPEARQDRASAKRGEPAQREWAITSTAVEIVPIQPGCIGRIQEKAFFDPLLGKHRIE